MVSMAVLAMILGILLRMFGQASDMWRHNRARIESFQAARNAFERVTQQVSQATLDTYLDYFDGTQSRTDVARQTGIVPVDFNSSRYDWASDLQFVTGQASTLIPNAKGETPTQAVFFVAPTGTSASADYRRLDTLLNALGFYIEYLSDGETNEVPPFLHTNDKYTKRARYRLIELNQPSEKLRIYSDSQYSGAGSWYNQAVDSPDGTGSSTFVLADNVIALILRPRASSAEKDTTVGQAIESSYAFDSKGYLTGGDAILKNQLPPLVQVTMVTVDEVSMDRYEHLHGSAELTDVTSGLFTNPDAFDQDLAKLEKNLSDLHLEFRVFTTDVSLRGAKSNLNQSNPNPNQ